MQRPDRRTNPANALRRTDKDIVHIDHAPGLPPAHVAWAGRAGLPPHINLGLSAPVPIAPRQPLWRKPLRPLLVGATKAIAAFPPAYRLLQKIFSRLPAVEMRLAAYIDPEEAARARARLEREAARKHAEQVFASKPPVLLTDATLYVRIHGQLQDLSSSRKAPTDI